MASDEALHRRRVQIANRLGLHARAAARFAALAGEYAAEIQVSHQTHTANAKSIMGLMMLAAGQGSDIELRARGDDAQAALEAIAALIADGFGEAD
ncbi:HPr family phosphocarrier protein [Spiribacter roseus]|uniref:HPr family phosphocarrier protein n=1 Tax=Spiribacter roseus TaxID=1855875 RepID=UPI0013302418|nr:HPr family phosphocarrier protein [Spiribacter roseus]KAF0284435.1 hypothetical protein BA898_08875 [Spiribacter roseus]